MTNEERQQKCEEAEPWMREIIDGRLQMRPPRDGSSRVVAMRITVILQHEDGTCSVTGLAGGVSQKAVDHLDPCGPADDALADPDHSSEYTVEHHGREH